MDIRSIIALFMGLVIQLSQVQTSVAAESVKTCATSAQRMDCCEGLKSCPCAKKTEQREKPAPLIPTAVDLKLFVSKATGSGSFEAFYFPPTDTAFFSASRLESKVGYAGVPLSVAFCRFVI
ncbi:MAG: hypothetical protein ABIS50_14250 [Luteolibacter sp.]|uniref:hypothetical protein n=1 Tax=Luteolibacter sp. TaxID=1962973 RepID=UPI0032662C46